MTFKTKKDKMVFMNEKTIENLVTTKEIADVTGTDIKNVRRTYMNNQYGKSKEKMLKCLAYGTYLQEYTSEEIKFAKQCIEAKRLFK